MVGLSRCSSTVAARESADQPLGLSFHTLLELPILANHHFPGEHLHGIEYTTCTEISAYNPIRCPPSWSDHKVLFSTSEITMSRSHLVKTTRLGFRAVRCSNARRAPFRPALSASSAVKRSTWSSSSHRFSTCAVRPQSTQPDNASAATPASEAKPVIPTPAELSVNTYHELADAWLDHALARFEELQDQSDDIDVEYSVRKPSQPPTQTFRGKPLTIISVRSHDPQGR